MRRALFTEDHEAFRELASDFIEKEVVPVYSEWEKGGRMPRDVFTNAHGRRDWTVACSSSAVTATDARVARIYAGTSEVMKVIIAKSLGL